MNKKIKNLLMLTLTFLLTFLIVPTTISAEETSVNLQEANELIERWLSSEQVEQIEFKALDEEDYDQETFKISPGSDNRILIEGTSTSSLLMGWNWYMKYEANSNISFNGENLDLEKELPQPKETIVKQASVEHRYALNDTDEGYNDPYADWEDWERKIDILAMHGINEVQVFPGQEAIYQETFKDFGYTEEEMREWIAGPAHQPWWLMQNLSHIPQEMPQEAIDKRVELGQKIADRLRALDMTPVFAGYYGMVPFGLKDKYPEANIIDQGTYHNLEQPDWIDTTTDLYADIAATFYQHQRDLFGDTTMFKMDLFHEGGKSGNVDIGAASIAVQEALNTAHPDAIWVHLGWHSNPLPETIAAIDKEKALILDGIADRNEAKNREEDWDHTPYAFGTIWNFGGHTNMAANLTVWNQKFHEWKDKENSALAGTALLPEAVNNNPFAVEFFTELAWHDEPQDLDKWVEDFVTARYGAADPDAIEAWKTIQKTAYDLPANNDSQRATDLYSVRPGLDFDFPYWKEALNYDKSEFEKALTGLLETDSALHNSSAYQYDLMDVTRTVLANRGRILLPEIKQAYQENDKELFDELSAEFLHYIDLTEKVTATNKDSMLGPWLEKAKTFVSDDLGNKQLEYDAKSLISIWSPHNSLNDYGRRQWSGLTGDYYYSRWKNYFDLISAAIETNTEPESIDWYIFGLEWVRKSQDFPLETKGNLVEIANDVHNELENRLIADLKVTSDVNVIAKDTDTLLIKATFINKNGLSKVENVELNLSTPDGYTIESQENASINSLNINEELNVVWRVNVPDNHSKKALERFVVTANYGDADESKKITEDFILRVENEVQSPFKTVSYNDAAFSHSELDNEFTIYGGGEDWWKSYDEFGAIYKEKALASTDTVTVKVDYQDNTSPYARAGIVVRNNLDEKGSKGYLNLSVTPENGVRLSWDKGRNGTVDTAEDLGNLSAPVYLKLSRDESEFTGYASKDGKIWTKVGTVSLPDANPLLDVGIAMSAVNRHSSEYGLVTFSEFETGLGFQEMLAFDSSQKTIPRGIPVNVTTVFENRLSETIENLTTSLDLPETWEVKEISSTKESELLPGEKVEQNWQITIPDDFKFNRYNIKASANFEVENETRNSEDILPIQIVSVKDSLADAFNNIGITNDENPGLGNLDTVISFSAQSLAEEGFVPGSHVTYNGMEFKLPNVSEGTPDNVKGQAAIRVDSKGDKIAFIGTAVGTKTTDQQGTATLVYSDGSTEEFTLKYANYYARHTPSENSVVAVDGRNKPSGPVNLNYKYQILYDSVSLDPDKTLSVVILPDKSSMHTFAMTTEVEGMEDSDEAQKAARLVDQMIYRLPNVGALTFEDAGLVEAARAAYENLSAQAKTYVKSLENLEIRENRIAALNPDGEEVADKFAVRALQRRIYRLPSARVLTLADAPQVDAIRADYESLNEASKELFSPQYLKNLVLREAKLAELTNKAAAEEFDRLVAQFKEADEVTEAYKEKVSIARAAYDALSEEAKTLVHPANVGKLERAEAKIAAAD